MEAVRRELTEHTRPDHATVNLLSNGNQISRMDHHEEAGANLDELEEGHN